MDWEADLGIEKRTLQKAALENIIVRHEALDEDGRFNLSRYIV
jgi:hypothetical protein